MLLCRCEAVVVFAQENDSKFLIQGVPQACPQALSCQMFPTTDRPSVVGESCCRANGYWGRDSPSLTYESKESFDRAFEDLRAPMAWLALSITFPPEVLQGVPH